LTKSHRDKLLESLQDPASGGVIGFGVRGRRHPGLPSGPARRAEARGMSRLVAETDLNRESLYRMAEGNPRLSSLEVLLHTFGLRSKFVNERSREFGIES
jgi:hypothetical protein